MRQSELPALECVLGAYFHQDWNSDFVDDVAVLNEIVAVFPPHGLSEAAAEIRELLTFDFSDDDLNGILWRSARCYFSPSAFGLTARGWMKEVAERFEQASLRHG